MQIITKQLKDLKDAEYNPRQLTKDQYKHLKDSIQRFGLVDPIIINKNSKRKNIVIGGHQRLKVSNELGISDIPCVELDLSPKEERELNIRLNTNTGEWDWDILANNFDVEELVDWGFNQSNLAGFSDLDYSILDNENIDNEMEEMLDGTRKAIQIEFTLEDYEVALNLINELRKSGKYVGGLIIRCLNETKTGKS